MANFAVNNNEVLDSLNYILSGPVSIGQDQEGVGLSNPVYFTNNQSPYVSVGIPSPPPDKDTWIKTDCFAVVNIDTPDQKISVGGQLRGFISYDVTSAPATLRVKIGIVRFPGTTVVNTNSGTVLSETNIELFNVTTGIETDDSFGNQIIVSYIDQPGLDNVIGIYTYWLMVRAEDVSGTQDILDISADVRNLIATKIKS